ncbi:peptide deformylase [Patescibacteria group bacterium]|nr:peptide deformylase [Patescibacteria group bacterium]
MSTPLQTGEGNKILRTRTEEIDLENLSFDLQKFSEEMIETMREEKGAGLAAPQVDKPVRMVVVDFGGEPIIMINPEITFFSKEKHVDTEGCLSLPGDEYLVERSKKIRIKYIDLEGNKIKDKAKGLHSRIMQHEIDHLNGVLICDK